MATQKRSGAKKAPDDQMVPARTLQVGDRVHLRGMDGVICRRYQPEGSHLLLCFDWRADVDDQDKPPHRMSVKFLDEDVILVRRGQEASDG